MISLAKRFTLVIENLVAVVSINVLKMARKQIVFAVKNGNYKRTKRLARRLTHVIWRAMAVVTRDALRMELRPPVSARMISNSLQMVVHVRLSILAIGRIKVVVNRNA